MRRKSGYLAFLTAAALFLSVCGCNSAGPGHAEETSIRLAKNMVLKRGWSELPVAIYISNSVPERFRPAIVEAMEMWNDEAGIPIFEYAGETPDDAQGRDGLNGIYWDENPSPKGYFGEARTTTVNKDVIVESDIVFFGDPDSFDTLSCEDGKEICRSKVMKKDVKTTALHELGHVLGFVHTDGPADIMNPDFQAGDVHCRFDALLISELQDVYGPIMIADAR
ncbi:MAG: matrixin family metalloprotease [Proteobacteria bacterium]|nr:matrixin family metalloprotease [Pseudomonadota bacterium]